MGDPLILVAEDERDMRQLIVFTFQLDGFNVVDVSNGEDAVAMALKIRPDLISLDVRMPKMTGYEACKILKSDERTKDIPIVFLSAKGQQAEVDMGLDLGAEEYFLKPFAPDEVSNRVKIILMKYGKW